MRHDDILARTDWSAVEHACAGSAGVRETPAILEALLSDDAAAQAEALGDLYNVVHHQDTIYSATPPAVRFVAAVLDDPRTLTPVPGSSERSGEQEPLRAGLLDWLTSVMEAAAESDRWGPSGESVDVDSCRAARGQVYRAAYAKLADSDPTVVSAALGTIACVLEAPELQHLRPGIAAWLNSHALSAPDRRIRVMAVLTLSSWGHDNTPVLRDDPDLVVRATAALSPAQAADPAATKALLEVLASPTDAAWCQQAFPHFGRIFPFKLLPAVIDRVPLDGLIPALEMILAAPPDGTYAGDWGTRLRAKAFPGGTPPTEAMSDAQRALLDVLAKHCFGAAAPPVSFACDPRTAFSDLMPQGRAGAR
ncbi:hypothetical protein QLQ12_44565 [Actinoplanes sp. NEAU-A12]|uniref:HEAT repeat domain-containing protein n=1 Tax=Actinoplanes sandaracinus TaxID=3045177 RepID=A0ABT6X0Y0_9ACTN|nr:hypothetical protein [Actinoplanes sandaracinus]MDI6105677.1 hypothetical protein [Actinoplanes sandaracinus]